MSVVAISWSGGKDCCLACWKMMSQGFDVRYLVNTYRHDSERVAFHGTRKDLIRSQADAMGMELVQVEVHDHDYEEKLVGTFKRLVGKVDGIVFGDIDIPQNREWSTNAAEKAGLRAHFPLWAVDQRELLKEFIDFGFKAIVVCVDTRFFKRDDLGREIDESWLRDLDEMRRQNEGAVPTHCGEEGEYHSFVYDGPLLERILWVKSGSVVTNGNFMLIDIEECV